MDLVEKRPSHVLFILDPLQDKIEETMACIQAAQIPMMTVFMSRTQRPASVSSTASLRIEHEPLNGHWIRLLRSFARMGRLVGPASAVQGSIYARDAPNIDLIISTQRVLALDPCPAMSIQFAQVYHYPPEESRGLSFDKIIIKALCEYSDCIQNWGK